MVDTDTDEFVNCRLNGYYVNSTGHLVLERAAIDTSASLAPSTMPMIGGYDPPPYGDEVGVAIVCESPTSDARISDLRLVVHEVEQLAESNRHFE